MKTRVISTAILLPIVLLVIVVGAWALGLLITVIVFIAGMEYAQLLKQRGYRLSLFWIWGMILLWIMDVYWTERLLHLGLPLLTLSAAAWEVFRTQGKLETPIENWALTLAGGLYLGMGGSYLLRLRAQPDGLWWLLTALFIVWVGDSAAYLVGRRWGSHKMTPQISPNKTWEGYAGELVFGVGTGILLAYVWPLVAGAPLSLTGAVGAALGLLLAALVPLGDFFVSLIKREVGAKDTGQLIPGHGGVLDRLDSPIWAGFLTWLFVNLIN
jgi:phosphatidate cytidylyltransferase